MSRVAVVTCGTRGIGRAICGQLKADGFRVAAVYAGNDQTARTCREELEIPTMKCHVAESEACRETIRLVEELLGPVDVLVNNAGITHDGTLHKMDETACSRRGCSPPRPTKSD